MYSAALDTSSPTASIVIADSATNTIRTTFESRCTGRDSSKLLPEILQHLDATGIALADITHWTVGMGPGSFTGIRIGAATVKGICCGSGARFRGLPSSLAMAALAEPDAGQTVCVLHDGRRSEAIVSLWIAGTGLSPGAEPEARLIVELDSSTADHFVCLADDPIVAALPEKVAAKTRQLRHIDAGQLIAPVNYAWPQGDSDAERGFEPVYVRPPVFVPPRESRIHPKLKESLEQGERR
jgi:tRNA threonylcarbamoyl adenosine modification protein YeaZ